MTEDHFKDRSPEEKNEKNEELQTSERASSSKVEALKSKIAKFAPSSQICPSIGATGDETPPHEGSPKDNGSPTSGSAAATPTNSSWLHQVPRDFDWFQKWSFSNLHGWPELWGKI